MNKAKGVSHPCYKLNLLKNQTSQSTHRRTEGTKSKEESQSWGWTLNWLVLSFTLAVQWHEAQFASYIIQAGSFICTVLLGCMNSLYNWHLSLTNIQKSNIILLKYFILCVSTENRDLTKVKLLVSLTAGFIVEKANFTQPYHWWSRKLTTICKQLVVCDCIPPQAVYQGCSRKMGTTSSVQRFIGEPPCILHVATTDWSLQKCFHHCM